MNTPRIDEQDRLGSSDMGASQSTGLGSAEAPEPHSGLGPSGAIPSADDGFFYVEWVGKVCPFCGEAGVSGKSPAGHFFAGCPDPDCLAHNLAYDFVTVDHARAAWDQRYEASTNSSPLSAAPIPTATSNPRSGCFSTPTTTTCSSTPESFATGFLNFSRGRPGQPKKRRQLFDERARGSPKWHTK
jgi:hypothetical protein